MARSKNPRSALNVRNSASRACWSTCLSSANRKGRGDAIVTRLSGSLPGSRAGSSEAGWSGKEDASRPGCPAGVRLAEQDHARHDAGELPPTQRGLAVGFGAVAEDEDVAEVQAPR